MTSYPAFVQSVPAPTTFDLERRAAARHPCDMEAVSRPLEAPDAICWGGMVRDISPTGLRLALCYPFKPGTYLALDVQTPEAVRTWLAQVVHVEDKADGTWSLGCAFVRPVPDSELDGVV